MSLGGWQVLILTGKLWRGVGGGKGEVGEIGLVGYKEELIGEGKEGGRWSFWNVM